jgi:hypothetical protein
MLTGESSSPVLRRVQLYGEKSATQVELEKRVEETEARLSRTSRLLAESTFRKQNLLRRINFLETQVKVQIIVIKIINTAR